MCSRSLQQMQVRERAIVFWFISAVFLIDWGYIGFLPVIMDGAIF
jgi:hypothetical protein